MLLLMLVMRIETNELCDRILNDTLKLQGVNSAFENKDIHLIANNIVYQVRPVKDGLNDRLLLISKQRINEVYLYALETTNEIKYLTIYHRDIDNIYVYLDRTNYFYRYFYNPQLQRYTKIGIPKKLGSSENYKFQSYIINLKRNVGFHFIRSKNKTVRGFLVKTHPDGN